MYVPVYVVGADLGGNSKLKVSTKRCEANAPWFLCSDRLVYLWALSICDGFLMAFRCELRWRVACLIQFNTPRRFHQALILLSMPRHDACIASLTRCIGVKLCRVVLPSVLVLVEFAGAGSELNFILTSLSL